MTAGNTVFYFLMYASNNVLYIRYSVFTKEIKKINYMREKCMGNYFLGTEKIKRNQQGREFYILLHTNLKLYHV